jgi:thiosulfate/3-mercaptopyruvate sulfurtransferase
VLDARSYERFTGSVVQIDKRGGHIPGAKSACWSAVLDDDGRPRDPEELRAYYQLLGVGEGDEAVAYCGSGVSACMNVLAMERAGLRPPRLYVASWSGWSADESREAATGD